MTELELQLTQRRKNQTKGITFKTMVNYKTLHSPLNSCKTHKTLSCFFAFI